MATERASEFDLVPLQHLSTQELDGLAPDSEIWSNLKHAIADSSGFQRWYSECNGNKSLADCTEPVDVVVRRYLRETLETLAY
jgi:hypothetical protein